MTYSKSAAPANELPRSAPSENARGIIASRRRAKLIGLLFLIATGIGFVNLAILGPIFTADDVMTATVGAASKLITATFLNTIMAIAIVGIAVCLFPVLALTSRPLAVAYVVTRFAEGVVLTLAGLFWLSFLPNFIPTPSTAASILNWSNALFGLGAQIIFGVTAIILNLALMRATLVPKTISVWGLIGGVLIFGYGIEKIIGADIAQFEPYCVGPIALNEIVLAVWLILKGFRV